MCLHAFMHPAALLTLTMTEVLHSWAGIAQLESRLAKAAAVEKEVQSVANTKTKALEEQHASGVWHNISCHHCSAPTCIDSHSLSHSGMSQGWCI